MPSGQLESIRARLEDVLEGSSDLRVAGAVAAVAVGDEVTAVARGTANLNTGEPFTPDTGFLLGSVTKVMVTTVLMRLVERGLLDLDAPAKRYVPEFTLADPEVAERITVRMLVNHTNGMDADGLGPSPIRGRDAAKAYTAMLADRGVLFEPGAFVHYSNPGFVVAGRIIEELTGLAFERAIARELFEPAGLADATAIQTQAFLRRTAVGAFADDEATGLRATTMFTLAESMGGAGSTLIVSPQDMVAFGRMHLAGGVAPNGTRIISSESVAAMQTATVDTGLPQAPPIGLGWWLVPIAGSTAPWHGGGSPGGASSFCILPQHDAVIVSFVTGTGQAGQAALVNDRLHNAAIEELTGQTVTPPVDDEPAPPAGDVAGEYASFQVRTRVETDGDDLIVTSVGEPLDADHAEKAVGYGSDLKPHRVLFRSVAPAQFAPAGSVIDDLRGFYGRVQLLATLPAAPRRRAGLHQMLRYMPKVG